MFCSYYRRIDEINVMNNVNYWKPSWRQRSKTFSDDRVEICCHFGTNASYPLVSKKLPLAQFTKTLYVRFPLLKFVRSIESEFFVILFHHFLSMLLRRVC